MVNYSVLSYASVDADRVLGLRDSLATRGVQVWMDRTDLLPWGKLAEEHRGGNEIRKTYRHIMDKGNKRLGDKQSEAWIRAGLDRLGNPIAKVRRKARASKLKLGSRKGA